MEASRLPYPSSPSRPSTPSPRRAVGPSPHPHRDPRPRPRPWLWILCLVPVTLVGIAVAFVGLGTLYNMTGTEETLAPGERELMLDIGHLAGWMEGYAPDLADETVTKTRYADHSYDIQYTYEVPTDDSAPYLSYMLNFEPTETDADSTYFSLWGGSKVAFFAFGAMDVAVDEQDDLFRWGDESRFGVLRTEGKPFGNVFIAKRGKTVVYLLVTGIYFEDADNLSALLTPYLEKLDALPPSPE
jgi:hypothetical protein